MPLGSFGNVPDRNASSEELAEAFSGLLKEVTYLLNGGLDTLNVNELNADVINAGTLNALLVVVRAALTGATITIDGNGFKAVYATGTTITIDQNGFSITSGTKNTFKADVNGDVTIEGIIKALGGTIGGFTIGLTKLSGAGIIEGGTVRTKGDTEYPRAEMSSSDHLIAAFQAADNYVKLKPDAFGSTPGFVFHNGAGVDALIYLFNSVTQALSIATPAGSADISISSGRDMSLSGNNVSLGGIWTFSTIIHGDITGSASYAERAGTAAAADTMAPTGTISWFQVDKVGSSIASLDIRNLSDLTQSTSFRTVTDTEKSTWNGKAPLTSPAFTGTPTAPTPATIDNSTTLATTAYVQNQGFAKKQAPNWITVTLLNGWVNDGGVYAPVAYYIDEMGIVRFRGRPKNGSLGVLFVLDLGYRPVYAMDLTTFSFNGTIDSATLVAVEANGNVSYNGTAGTGALRLDGLSFTTG